MRQSFKRRRLARLVAAGVALAAIISGTVTASASASSNGWARCPWGYFCLFSGYNGTGTMWKYRTSQSDFGAAGRNAVGWINRTRNYSCLWPDKNYTSSSIKVAAPSIINPANPAYESDGIDAVLSQSKWRHHYGSVVLAPTWHECLTRKQYHEWYRQYDSPEGTPKPFGSFLGNGQSQILMRSLQGHLWVLPGDDTKPVDLGAGWNSMNVIVRHGDYTGDGREDIIARNAKGDLYLFPGNGRNHLGARKLLAHGWNTMSLIAAVGDVTGDKKNDLMGRDRTGTLWVYPGNGKGGFGRRIATAHGWNTITALFGPGEFTGDGKDDIVARDRSGNMWLYHGAGKGRFGKRTLLSRGISQAWELFSVGDVDGDAKNDYFQAYASVSLGSFNLFSGTGKGGIVRKPGWQATYDLDPRELFL
ncbi:ATP/GTP-binding protein [Planotetraspora thailandica]|uniref:ATP/GTP-binding protein n=1 Tax=Planotetraspora thailandica TaxID=487172 RepID=A0A8J3XXU3_9ACTN|nr:FG-GAP-like repeat-containing protein [Planotetraspora thailandica]GII53463.1 ATP/GTP-binding protein [Planotetraspora thailandica]